MKAYTIKAIHKSGYCHSSTDTDKGWMIDPIREAYKKALPNNYHTVLVHNKHALPGDTIFEDLASVKIITLNNVKEKPIQGYKIPTDTH